LGRRSPGPGLGYEFHLRRWGDRDYALIDLGVPPEQVRFFLERFSVKTRAVVVTYDASNPESLRFIDEYALLAFIDNMDPRPPLLLLALRTDLAPGFNLERVHARGLHAVTSWVGACSAATGEGLQEFYQALGQIVVQHEKNWAGVL
jgi:hypothetical protein